MGCCSCCTFPGTVRITIFIFNLTFLAGGIAMLVIGNLFSYPVEYYYQIEENIGGSNIVPGITVAVGVTFIIVSFLGCWATIRNDSCMLKSFAAALVVLFIIHLSVGIYGVTKVQNEDLKKDINEGIEEGFRKYDNNQIIRDLFQSVQSELKCCGVDGIHDYNIILGWKDGVVAGVCCGEPNVAKCTSPIYTAGCKQELYKAVTDSFKVVSYVAIGFGLTELVGAIFSMYLVYSLIRKGRQL